MSTKALTRNGDLFPSIFEDFARPWNEWFNNDTFFTGRQQVPAVNITENQNAFNLSLAVPGMKKDDFNIDVNGNMLTISCQKEEKKEDKQEKYTRREFNFTSFSRSFSLPQEVDQEKIEARYEDGVLKMTLPRKEETKKLSLSKQIPIR